MYKCTHTCIRTDGKTCRVNFNQSGTSRHCDDLQHTHLSPRCYVYWIHNQPISENLKRIEQDYPVSDVELSESSSSDDDNESDVMAPSLTDTQQRTLAHAMSLNSAQISALSPQQQSIIHSARQRHDMMQNMGNNHNNDNDNNSNTDDEDSNDNNTNNTNNSAQKNRKRRRDKEEVDERDAPPSKKSRTNSKQRRHRGSNRRHYKLSTSATMDSIQRVGIDKKIKLLYQLTRDIGDKLHKKESKQEDIFIQFAHHLFDGTRYATDGTIPPNVIHGLGDVFRRYGHHLAELIEYHRQLDPDYFVLYLDKFLDFDECQSKLNENALYLREHFGISTKKWDRKIRKWYADIKKIFHGHLEVFPQNQVMDNLFDTNMEWLNLVPIKDRIYITVDATIARNIEPVRLLITE
eukprot:1028006_1